jgi:hypothetical protein
VACLSLCSWTNGERIACRSHGGRSFLHLSASSSGVCHCSTVWHGQEDGMTLLSVFSAQLPRKRSSSECCRIAAQRLCVERKLLRVSAMVCTCTCHHYCTDVCSQAKHKISLQKGASARRCHCLYFFLFLLLILGGPFSHLSQCLSSIHCCS